MRSLRLIVAISLTALAAAPVFGLDGSTALEITAQDIPLSDWKIFELYTNGNNLSSIADPGYTQKVRFDGIGAYQHDANTVRVFFNHELGSNASSVSYLDLNWSNLPNWLALGSVAAPAQVVSHIGRAYTSIVGDSTLNNFCSSSMLEPLRFGSGRGLASRVYLTGEETGGGSLYAIDANPASGTYRTMYQCTALPTGAWENAIEFDTGRTDRVGLMLFEDAGSNVTTGTSPLRIWIGNKKVGGFLDQNGLSEGTTYYWIPSGSGTAAPARFTATDQSIAGVWSTSSVGAMLFSKLEDGHLSPTSGTMAAFNSQDQGTFTLDLSLSFDGAGNLITGGTSAGTVRFLLEETNDGGPLTSFNSQDNMAWSTGSLLFTQEDGSNQEIWQINPSSLNLNRDGLSIARVTGGAGESSGIVDISELLGYAAGSVLLTSSHSDTPGDNQMIVMFSPTATLLPEPAMLGGGALLLVALGRTPRRRANRAGNPR